MSKRNKNKYLVHNDDSKDEIIIREALQEQLKAKGFFKEIMKHDTIIIEEANQNASVHKFIVSNLDLPEVKEIWQVNLEQEIEGVSTKNYFKTPETALLILTKKEEQKYHNLLVILVEMKSSLQNNTLQACEEKFMNAINRLYLFLSLHEMQDNYEGETIQVKFKALIVYGKNRIKEIKEEKDQFQLYQILKKESINNVLVVTSLLSRREKIKIKFHDSSKITLQELINI